MAIITRCPDLIPIIQFDDEKREYAVASWNQDEAGEAETYLAVYESKIIGVMHAMMHEGCLWSGGTVVNRSYQHQGIAKELWSTAINNIRPQKINITVTSDRGYTLALSLKHTYPRISWDIIQNGNRLLRNMKKIKLNNTNGTYET